MHLFLYSLFFFNHLLNKQVFSHVFFFVVIVIVVAAVPAFTCIERMLSLPFSLSLYLSQFRFLLSFSSFFPAFLNDIIKEK